MSGVAISASKCGPVFLLDLLDHLFAAHEIGAGFLRFLLAVAGGNHGHGLGLAQSVRQNHGSAHHLVGMTRIDAQTHGQVDGLIKLGVLDLLAAGSLLQAADTPAW